MQRRDFLTAIAVGAMVALTLGTLSAESSSAEKGKSPHESASSRKVTILFFDDQRLNLRDNVVRKLGRPELIEEAIYKDPHGHASNGYPQVFRDERSGRWRMVYQIITSLGGHEVAVVAESDDGLRWKPLDTTGEVKFAERVVPHQVHELEGLAEWIVFVDPFAEPAERLKGLRAKFQHGIAKPGKTMLLVSPDGVRWRLKEGIEWQNPAPDPPVYVFWNEVRQSYCITTRPDVMDRRLAVMETKDWENFTRPELALQPDALDTPLAEAYGMPVLSYEDYYIGLLWLYHPPPQPVPGGALYRYKGGHVDCQLAYSLNGWHFQRGLRDPFIPNGAPGQPDSGSVYPSSMVVDGDGSLLIYASACTHEHARKPPDSGSILAYRLRRDGFVFLESGGGVGVVGTRALYWRGGELELNVQSQGGHVRAQITDHEGVLLEGYRSEECESFTGDNTAWKPVWKGGKTLAALANKTIRVEVELDNARIYAISGDFIPLSAPSCRQFEIHGVVPTPRPGF